MIATPTTSGIIGMKSLIKDNFNLLSSNKIIYQNKSTQQMETLSERKHKNVIILAKIKRTYFFI